MFFFASSTFYRPSNCMTDTLTLTIYIISIIYILVILQLQKETGLILLKLRISNLFLPCKGPDDVFNFEGHIVFAATSQLSLQHECSQRRNINSQEWMCSNKTFIYKKPVEDQLHLRVLFAEPYFRSLFSIQHQFLVP